MGKRYKKSTAEKGIPDETFDDTKTALFRVQGKSLSNIQAVQVDQVSSRTWGNFIDLLALVVLLSPRLDFSYPSWLKQ